MATSELFEIFLKKLKEYVGENEATNIVEALPDLQTAPFAPTTASKACEDGTLIKVILQITALANKINAVLPESQQVEKQSLTKVCLLQQISKAEIFEKNISQWEITNRGILYKYKVLDGAIGTGTRSLLIASNAGVKFTPLECEAMLYIDKNLTLDKQAAIFSSAMSVIIKTATELVEIENRTKK